MPVKRINIVAHTHYDVGYTDHPAVTEKVQCRGIDRALELMLKTRDFPDGARFKWTQEVTWGLRDWWERSSVEKRAALVRCAENGQYEVCAFPFSATPCMDRAQWEYALDEWLPEEIACRFPLSVGMQTDVNGLPLAAVRMAVRRGVRRFWMGPNGYLGCTPFPLPWLFRWDVGAGVLVTVWVNEGYGNFHGLIGYGDWRRGPVPAAADLLYHAPGGNEIFDPSTENILRCHARLMRNLAERDKAFGYFPELPVSCTNQYRYDNDPPPEKMSEFIREWNRLGLEPRLELVLPSEAIARVERSCGFEIPVYSGQWPDWWVRGSASLPREMAASRRAKRTLSLFREGGVGELPEEVRRRALESLSFFNEHSFDSYDSVSRPWSEMSQGTVAVKSDRAFAPAAELDLCLADAVRGKIRCESGELILYNPSSERVAEFVTFPAHVLRGEWRSARDRKSGRLVPLEFFPGWEDFRTPENLSECSIWNRSRIHGDRVPGRGCGFWSGELVPGEARVFELLEQEVKLQAPEESWQLECDAKGWPERAGFAGIGFPLFTRGSGDFISKRVTGNFPRDCYRRIFAEEKTAVRRAMIREAVTILRSRYRKAERLEHDGMFEIRQYFSHPGLYAGCRKMEFFREEPRIRFTLTIDRKPDFEPEVFSLHFALGGMAGIVPELSCGGEIFRPGIDQIPGSCMDYYAVDGTVLYRNGRDNLVFHQKDNALLSLGKPYFCEKVKRVPENTHDLWPILFDNTWDTNFPPDSNGLMEFRFEWFVDRDLRFDAAVRRSESLAQGLLKIK